MFHKAYTAVKEGVAISGGNGGGGGGGEGDVMALLLDSLGTAKICFAQPLLELIQLEDEFYGRGK